MKYYKYVLLLMLIPLSMSAKIYKCLDDQTIIYKDTDCGSKYKPLGVDKFLSAQDKLFDSEINPNEDVSDDVVPGKKNIKVNINEDQHFRIPGIIHGESVVFLVDTGATTVVMATSLAEKLKLEKLQEVQVNTANGEITGYETVIKKLVLDGILLKNITAVMAPNIEADELLLGMNVISLFKMIQDSSSLELILE